MSDPEVTFAGKAVDKVQSLQEMLGDGYLEVTNDIFELASASTPESFGMVLEKLIGPYYLTYLQMPEAGLKDYCEIYAVKAMVSYIALCTKEHRRGNTYYR